MTSLIILLMLPHFLLGLFLFIKVIFLKKKPPMDTSNRIAHMRLVWFAISRPEMFAEYFGWLRKDEHEIVENANA